MSEPGTFPTFCHISQYGQLGYENLHRMLAVSSPLNIWAPSSVELASGRWPIGVERLLRYVEQGHLRIIGRRSWLTERRKRDEHPWEGARWYPPIDDALKAIFENDESETDPRRRRVLAARDEGGRVWAEDYIDSHPGEVDRWYRIGHGRQARDRIPAGTYEAVLRVPDDRRQVARAVLRDAYNHGQAIIDAGADCPVLLAPSDARFLKIISSVPADGNPTAGIGEQRRLARTHHNLGTLTRTLVEDLGKLEPHRADLADFIGHEGHTLLVAWFAALAEEVKREDPRRVDEKASRALRDGLAGGRFDGFSTAGLGRRLAPTMDFAAAAVGVSTAALGVALSQDALGVLGMLACAYDVGNGLGKHLGWIPAQFDGPQWPFLYMYGQQATQRRRREVLQRLEVGEAGAATRE